MPDTDARLDQAEKDIKALQEQLITARTAFKVSVWWAGIFTLLVLGLLGYSTLWDIPTKVNAALQTQPVQTATNVANGFAAKAKDDESEAKVSANAADDIARKMTNWEDRFKSLSPNSVDKRLTDLEVADGRFVKYDDPNILLRIQGLNLSLAAEDLKNGSSKGVSLTANQAGNELFTLVHNK